jgi:RNA polymerase sigma-54 factor
MELAANPLLEEIPPEESAPEFSAEFAPPLPAANSHADSFGDGNEGAEVFDISARLPKRDNEVNDDYNDIMQKMENDWKDDIRDDSQTLLPHTGEDDARRQHIFDSATGAESLEENLLKQARLAAPSPEVFEAIRALVGELDARGYMTADLGALCLQTSLPRATLDEAWKILKTFDPPGIGAADLRECLLIQLLQTGRRHTLAALIVDEYFPLLLKRRLSEIARSLGATPRQIDEALAVLARLSTSPARNFASDDNRAVFPDIIVRRAADDSGWEPVMTREYIPRLRLNQSYKSLLAAKTLKPGDREYIREKMRSGNFLISAIEQRQNTLERIARLILKHQTDFFDNGVSRLHPLTMSVIAPELGLHVTTVSRAIANKTMLTPHGLFELRYFFTSGLTTDSGDTMASVSVRRLLADIIAKENPAAPLGDKELADRLRARGANIARRTIAKYRDALNIPPSHLRKRR